MKLAIISDVHGNYKALEAFLDYIETHPVDGIICLGDYVTDSPFPRRTMELLYRMRKEHTCYMLRGNREDYLLENERQPQGWHPSSSNGALYYTSLHIRQEDLRFFESLPTEQRLSFPESDDMTICHGVPGAVRGNMEIEEGLRDRVLKLLDTCWLIGGHSHHQEVCTLHGKYYLNPGSLGLCIDGQGRHAQFALLSGDEKGWHPQLLTIDYDVDSFLKDFTASGLDECAMTLNRAIKKTLLTGVNYFFYSIKEVLQMTGGVVPLGQIGEDVWQAAAEKLEI